MVSNGRALQGLMREFVKGGGGACFQWDFRKVLIALISSLALYTVYGKCFKLDPRKGESADPPDPPPFPTPLP